MSNSEINIRRIQRGSRAWCRSELFHSNGMSQSMKITSRFVYRVLLGFGLRLPYPRPSKRASALQHSFPADLNELVRLERFQFHFQRTSNTFTKHLLRLFSHFATTLKTKLLFFFKKKGSDRLHCGIMESFGPVLSIDTHVNQERVIEINRRDYLRRPSKKKNNDRNGNDCRSPHRRPTLPSIGPSFQTETGIDRTTTETHRIDRSDWNFKNQLARCDDHLLHDQCR